MTLIVERPSQAADIQSAIDDGERVVIERPVAMADPLILRGDMDLVIRRRARLTAPGYAAKAEGAGRIYRPMISGGGVLACGLDLTDVSGFEAWALEVDVTADDWFIGNPALVCSTAALYNRIHGFRLNAFDKGVHLLTGGAGESASGANGFQIRGGDIHLHLGEAEGVHVETDDACEINRVWLDGLSVEGPGRTQDEFGLYGGGSTALRIVGGATKTAHVVDAVSCEWGDPTDCHRTFATGKHRVDILSIAGNAPDHFDGNGWFTQALYFGYGFPHDYAGLPMPDKVRMRP